MKKLAKRLRRSSTTSWEFLNQQDLLNSEFHYALEELSSTVVLVGNSFIDVFKDRDPGMMGSLMSATK